MTQLFSTTRRAGNLIFLSGQCGFDETGELVSGGLGAETSQTLKNIALILDKDGLTLRDVVAITCYVVDIDDRPVMDASYVDAFGDIPLPTRTTVEVSALPEGLKIEMTAIAVIGA